jgi:hypothetical protein
MSNRGWACPDCGRKFARTRQRHVCQKVTVGDHLRDADPAAVRLYERFVQLLDGCGPYELAPIARQIGFRGTSRIFAAARPRDAGLEGYLDLTHADAHPMVHHVAAFAPGLWVHHFRLSSEEEMDDSFRAAVCEARDVGDGHRRRRARRS